jgi:dihydroneopterin aldolase
MKVLGFTSLRINDLRVMVRLGCTAGERAQPQEVRVSVKLAFAKIPKALSTDRLKDAVDYSDICASIKSICTGREFEMVEFLGAEILKEISKEVPPGTKIYIRVHKVRPPIEDLLGGVLFYMGVQV